MSEPGSGVKCLGLLVALAATIPRSEWWTFEEIAVGVDTVTGRSINHTRLQEVLEYLVRWEMVRMRDGRYQQVTATAWNAERKQP